MTDLHALAAAISDKSPNIKTFCEAVADILQPVTPPPAAEFPIGVWLQSPGNAAAYAKIGVNRYVRPTSGDTATYDALKAAGIQAFVDAGHQGAALAYSDQSVIAGWVLPDEPDNAQFACPAGVAGNNGKCCMTPAALMADYNAFKKADPMGRPVYVELGRALGNPAAPDRGDFYYDSGFTPADFYAACDQAGNDVYPVNNGNGQAGPNGPLTEVADAVDRMRQYAPGKPCWQVIETTQIEPQNGAPTPAQVTCEVWLALIHGASGISYFCHQNPNYETWAGHPFDEAHLLHDQAMSAAVGSVNSAIQRLAGPLLSPIVSGVASGVASVSAASRIDYTVRDFGGHRYLFAANPAGSSVSATFTVQGAGTAVTVLDENRTVAVSSGRFLDTFSPYAVHLYQVG